MIGIVLHLFDHLSGYSHLHSGKQGSCCQGWWNQFGQGGEQQTWNDSTKGLGAQQKNVTKKSTLRYWKASLIVEAGKNLSLKTTSSEHPMCHELVSRCQLAILLRTSRLTQNSACTSQCQPKIINAWDQNHQKFQSNQRISKNQGQFHEQNFMFLNFIFFKMTTIGCSVCRLAIGGLPISLAQWHLARALVVGSRAVHDFGAAPFGREQCEGA